MHGLNMLADSDRHVSPTGGDAAMVYRMQFSAGELEAVPLKSSIRIVCLQFDGHFIQFANAVGVSGLEHFKSMQVADFHAVDVLARWVAVPNDGLLDPRLQRLYHHHQ